MSTPENISEGIIGLALENHSENFVPNFPYYNTLDQIYHSEWATAKLARLEQLRVVVPYLAQSEPILYDESGRKRTTGLVARSQSGTTELELTLGGGQVSVVEFPVAARR